MIWPWGAAILDHNKPPQPSPFTGNTVSRGKWLEEAQQCYCAFLRKSYRGSKRGWTSLSPLVTGKHNVTEKMLVLAVARASIAASWICEQRWMGCNCTQSDEKRLVVQGVGLGPALGPRWRAAWRPMRPIPRQERKSRCWSAAAYGSPLSVGTPLWVSIWIHWCHLSWAFSIKRNLFWMEKQINRNLLRLVLATTGAPIPAQDSCKCERFFPLWQDAQTRLAMSTTRTLL